MEREIENYAMSEPQLIEFCQKGDSQYSQHEYIRGRTYFEQMQEENEITEQASEEIEEPMVVDDLQDFERCKERESATSSLNVIFKNTMELLLKAQAKEEVELCTLQFNLREVLYNQRNYDEIIENGNLEIQQFQEMLQRNLYDRNLITKEICTSTKVLDVLQKNLQQIIEENDQICKATDVLEVHCDNLFKKCETKINKWKTTIKETEEQITAETTKFTEYKEQCEATIREEETKLNELCIELSKVTHELETSEVETEQLKTQLRLDEAVEKDLALDNQKLQILIDSIDLEMVQNELDSIEESKEAFLTKVKNDMDSVEKCLSEVELRNSNLEIKLNCEKSLTAELEQNIVQSQQEEANLRLANDKLKAAIIEMEVKIKEKTNESEKKLTDIDNEFLKINEHLITTKSESKKKLRALHEISKNMQELNATLSSVIDSETKCYVQLDLIKSKSEKLDEENTFIENKIENYHAEEKKLKDKISNQEDVLEQEIRKRDVSQEGYAKVIKECESTIGSLLQKKEDLKIEVKEKRNIKSILKESDQKLQTDTVHLFKLRNEERRLRETVYQKQNQLRSFKRNLNQNQISAKKVATYQHKPLDTGFQSGSDTEDEDVNKNPTVAGSNIFLTFPQKH